MLDAAFRTFAERGYEGTTLRELAKELGVSHHLLNVRFGTKEDLWRRARAGGPDRAAGVRGLRCGRARGRGTAARPMLRFCRWAADNGDFAALSYVEGRGSTWRNDYIGDAYLRPFKERLDALLAAVAAKRPVHPISTSALMALLVQGVGFYFASAPMLDGLGVGAEIFPEQAERQIAICADSLLRALLPDGG